MEVRATQPGYFNLRYQKEGAVFAIKSDKEFSDRWMEKVQAGEKPPKPSKSSKQPPVGSLAAKPVEPADGDNDSEDNVI